MKKIFTLGALSFLLSFTFQSHDYKIENNELILPSAIQFKANTDDLREASSLTVIRDLLNAGATICAYDPVAMPAMQRMEGDWSGLTFANTQAAALQDADALVIVTEWKEFRSPDFELIKTTLKNPVIFDGRNLYDPPFVRSMQIEYIAIGR